MYKALQLLLLEDDILLAQLLEEHLSQKGYKIVHFIDGEEAAEYLHENRVDLLLLDINVPGIRGNKLLQNLRSNSDTTPAIFITSNNSAQDVQAGFAVGCDDYIKKPFEFPELDARIEHVLKIYNLNSRKIILGKYIFEPSLHILRKKDKTHHLTPKESELLHYFATHQNRLITKEELIKNLWDEFPTDATIRTYIKNLRHYFPNIKTVRGKGYVFNSL